MAHIRISVLLLCALIVSACTEDIDFDPNDRSFDITVENSEQLALNVFQSTFLAHFYLPLHDFLDGSDLPEDAIAMGGGYFRSCDLGGTAEYTFSRASGDEHKAGDTVSVSYDQCQNEVGIVHNGKLSGAYSSVDGLNSTFQQINRNACASALYEEFGDFTFYLGNFDVNDNPFVADDVRVRQLEDQFYVDYVMLDDSDDPQHIVQGTSVWGATDTVLIINNKLARDEDLSSDTETVYKFVGAANPSLGGDEFYVLEAGVLVKQNCQKYERSLNLSFDGLSTGVDGAINIEISGGLKISEGSENFIVTKKEVVNSDYQVDVTQGNLRAQYNLKGMDISRTESSDNQSFTYTHSGQLAIGRASTVDGVAVATESSGVVDLTTVILMMGFEEDILPNIGIFAVLGQGSETLNITAESDRAKFDVGYDGDNNGDGRVDFEERFYSFWQDILNRNFTQTE